MTKPINQTMLKSQMEKLAVICVSIRAAAVDCLLEDTYAGDDWNAIAFMCNQASNDIYRAITMLHDVALRIKDQS